MLKFPMKLSQINTSNNCISLSKGKSITDEIYYITQITFVGCQQEVFAWSFYENNIFSVTSVPLFFASSLTGSNYYTAPYVQLYMCLNIFFYPSLNFGEACLSPTLYACRLICIPSDIRSVVLLIRNIAIKLRTLVVHYRLHQPY